MMMVDGGGGGSSIFGRVVVDVQQYYYGIGDGNDGGDGGIIMRMQCSYRVIVVGFLFVDEWCWKRCQ